MRNIKVVIGANFGDEGKGLMTDYFCSQVNEPVLNIRFNGSCQAGHTVVKGNKRHVFSHFGAGSFNENVVTYLSSYFYINPILFNSEYDTLVSLGVTPKVLVDKDAHIVLLYDILLNRETENSRGDLKHGSCGLGLWEAVLREDSGFIFRALSMRESPLDLYRQIVKCRDSYFQDTVSTRFNKTLLEMVTEEMCWYDDFIIDLYILELKKMFSRIEIVSSSVIKEYSNVVFEGAQGLLLDWDNSEYMPHLTASYTGLRNVVSILNVLELFKESSIEICYVTRTYTTRHGAGRFDSEVDSKEELGLLEDKTNVYNQWQGMLRYGLLDVDLLLKSINKDLGYISNITNNYNVSLCITHLNETNNQIYSLSGRQELKTFVKELPSNFNIYCSNSEFSSEITEF